MWHHSFGWRDSDYLVEIMSSLQCDLVLRYIHPVGFGVYAGKDFGTSEFYALQRSPGLVVPLQSVYNTELINYSEGYNSTHGLVTLGHGMMYNHISPGSKASVNKFPLEHFHGMLTFLKYSGKSFDILFEANGFIEAGSQIFSNYGEGWFSDRGLEEYQPTSNEDKFGYYSVADIHNHPQSIPGCGTLLTTYINGQLRATTNLFTNQIIEVSRAIRLPIQNETSNPTQYGALNEYLWWSPKQDKCFRYALLLSGYGSLYGDLNIDDAAKESDSLLDNDVNVVYDWWPNYNLFEKILVQTDGLQVNESCAFGHHTNSTFKGTSNIWKGTEFEIPGQLMVSFAARRNIEKGEVLKVQMTRDKFSSEIRYMMPHFAYADCRLK